MKTVHVVGSNTRISRMFETHSWTLVDDVEDADLVQFCGGPDVDPTLYGDRQHAFTNCDIERDEYETALFHLAVESGCGIAGICRGAQLVHVLNGGSLWQDVDGHALGSTTHIAWLQGETNGFHVSSTHHQMMKEGTGEVLLHSRIARQKEDGDGASHLPGDYLRDVECMWHDVTGSICYQPHPEYFASTHQCKQFYFQLIKRLLIIPEGDIIDA